MIRLRATIFFLFLALFLPTKAERGVLDKMSPRLRAIFLKYETSNSKTISALVGSTPLFLFVKTSSAVDDLYRENDCEVEASFGDIEIVKIPKRNLRNVALDERVERLEIGRAFRADNAFSSKVIDATPAHEGLLLPQAYTGKGVVVGVQDIGLDLTNPNFYSRDMAEYRIKALWDMLSTDTLDSAMPIGNDYKGEAALLELAHSRDGLSECHGSHTLGTIAGSGYGSQYAGIAYDSDICLVNNITTENKGLLPDIDEAELGTALTALGFKYIFDYADSVGKPCVISFSEGSHEGFEEENLLYYEVLSSMVREGRIIVASAGNNSLDASYIHKPVGQERAGSFIIKYDSQLNGMAQGTNDFATRFVIYGSQADTIYIDTASLRSEENVVKRDTLVVDGREYAFQYVAYPSCYDENNIVVEYDIQGPFRIGYDDVAPISIEVLGEEADVEVYSVVGNFITNARNPSLSDGEATHNINSPGAASAVIAVGATAYVTGYTNMEGDSLVYNYGDGGVKASFSSVGPTVDYRTKPDVMAPGANVISSTNSFYFEANPNASNWSDLVSSYEYAGRTYYWKADTGTSMSAPLVGGAIALWLEAKPDLTREEIIDVFAETCTHPEPSLSYPNNLYGYGQIDVYKGLLKILGIDKIEGISSSQPQGVHFAVREGRQVVVSFSEELAHGVEIKIYSVSGQLLRTTSVMAGTTTVTIPIQGSGSAVVAVQVNGGAPSLTGSTLLRIQ